MPLGERYVGSPCDEERSRQGRQRELKSFHSILPFLALANPFGLAWNNVLPLVTHRIEAGPHLRSGLDISRQIPSCEWRIPARTVYIGICSLRI